jgi:hypothetical protein
MSLAGELSTPTTFGADTVYRHGYVHPLNWMEKWIMNINPVLHKRLSEHQSNELLLIAKQASVVREIKDFQSGRRAEAPAAVRISRLANRLSRPIRSMVFELSIYMRALRS